MGSHCNNIKGNGPIKGPLVRGPLTRRTPFTLGLSKEAVFWNDKLIKARKSLENTNG